VFKGLNILTSIRWRFTDVKPANTTRTGRRL